MRYPWRERFPRLVEIALLVIYGIAYLWRRLLWRTTVIAITGSVGKTTSKELLGQILQSRHPTFYSFDTDNGDLGVPRSIMKIRPWHRFAVIEIGMGSRLTIARLAAMLKPDAAIILAVEEVHIKEFGSIERIRNEKAAVAKSVSSAGWVALNGNDPNVRSMAGEIGARAILFGSEDPGAWHARDVSARWPARLSFRLTRGGDSQFVQTQFVGEHWVSSVLGVLTAAEACGIPMESAIRLLERIHPHRARLEPVNLPGGAWMLRDDFSSSHFSWHAALRCLESAEGVRRWLILSNVSDIAAGSQRKSRMLALEAKSAIDYLVLVGMRAQQLQRHFRIQGFPVEQTRVFASWSSAAAWLGSATGEGDLILMRGYGADHLARILYAMQGEIACRREICERKCLCDFCRDLYGKTLKPPESLRDYYLPIYY
jgi:UDP-N-acetylmuramoyl-tripeptide--D-alanyl-D-alanine ligase